MVQLRPCFSPASAAVPLWADPPRPLETRPCSSIINLVPLSQKGVNSSWRLAVYKCVCLPPKASAVQKQQRGTGVLTPTKSKARIVSHLRSCTLCSQEDSDLVWGTSQRLSTPKTQQPCRTNNKGGARSGAASPPWSSGAKIAASCRSHDNHRQPLGSPGREGSS